MGVLVVLGPTYKVVVVRPVSMVVKGMTTSVDVGVTVIVELGVPLGGYSHAGRVKVVVTP